MSSVARVALLALFAVLVAGVLLMVAAVAPEAIGWRTFAVLSGSMEPAIPIGSAVVTRPVDPRAIRIGDVISFSVLSAPGVTVTHRVIGMDEIAGADPSLRLRTRGDANTGDDPVAPDLRQPVYRVVYWVPLAGYPITFASQPVIRALAVLLGLAVIWGTGWTGRGRRS